MEMFPIGVPEIRNARIIDAARYGSTMSGIANETGMPFASVRRAIYNFEDIGAVKTRRWSNKVFVTTNPNHPIAQYMTGVAKWITSVIWNPDIFIASIFEKNNIDYAFIGTTKIKYVRKESRNMVQIAVNKEHYEQAKKIIQKWFSRIGIKITETPNDIIGNAMSMIYVKCFPVDYVNYEEYVGTVPFSNETVKVRIADDYTEKEAMKNARRDAVIFITAM